MNQDYTFLYKHEFAIAYAKSMQINLCLYHADNLAEFSIIYVGMKNLCQDHLIFQLSTLLSTNNKTADQKKINVVMESLKKL